MIDVTVITPTLHREKLLLESVQSALRQRGVSVEVLVIDDSDEASARPVIEALGDPRVRHVWRQAPSGGRPGLLRNQGISLARGRYLHFLDDDDRLAEGALAALAGALDRAPSVGVAAGTVLPFGDGDGASLAHERAYFERAAAVLRACRGRFDLVASLLYKDAPLINSACMLRRSCAVSLGGYDPDIAYCEDAELYLRAVRAGGFVFVDRPVVCYRVGQPSMMHDLPGGARLLRESYAVMYAKYRARHGRLELFAMKLLARFPRRYSPVFFHASSPWTRPNHA